MTNDAVGTGDRSVLNDYLILLVRVEEVGWVGDGRLVELGTNVYVRGGVACSLRGVGRGRLAVAHEVADGLAISLLTVKRDHSGKKTYKAK